MNKLTKQKSFDLGIKALCSCSRIKGVSTTFVSRSKEVVTFGVRLGDTDDVERQCVTQASVEQLGVRLHEAEQQAREVAAGYSDKRYLVELNRQAALTKWLREVQGEEVIMEEQENTDTGNEPKVNQTTVVLQAPVNDEFSCMWLNGKPVVAVMTQALYLQLPTGRLDQDMGARAFNYTTSYTNDDRAVYVRLCGSVDTSKFVVVDVNTEKLQELLKYRDEIKRADKCRTYIETGAI